MADASNFLVIFDINPATPARLAAAMPGIIEILRDAGKESPELAFRAVQGGHFGYLMQSALNAHQLRSLIETPKFAQPVLSGSDRVLVLQLGESFAGQQGFSRATTWLQRHQK